MIDIVLQKGKRAHRLSLPTGWDDLPSDDSRRVCLKALLQKGTDIAGKLGVLIESTPLKVSLLRALPPDQIADLLKLMDGFSITATPTPLISYFNHNGKIHYLPAAHGRNMSAIEFPIADDYYEKYLLHNDEEALLYLVATLARPTHKSVDFSRTGDRRIPLESRAQVEDRAPRLKGLPDEIKVAVLMYFAGIKSYVHELYGPWLFDKKEDDKEAKDEEDEQQTGAGMFGWWGLYMDVAESGVFGNLDQVYQSNFHTICMYLVKKKEQQTEMERRMQLSSSPSREINNDL